MFEFPHTFLWCLLSNCIRDVMVLLKFDSFVLFTWLVLYTLYILQCVVTYIAHCSYARIITIRFVLRYLSNLLLSHDTYFWFGKYNQCYLDGKSTFQKYFVIRWEKRLCQKLRSTVLETNKCLVLHINA